ncbi:MAG TPA: hypothetical protein VFG68_09010 [Fimbriiglobus sp.]|nr:hypothetical protein [Fimbriiglobus sp.]
MIARRGLCWLAAVAALAWSAGDATADFTIEMNNSFNGAAPAGSVPWGRASFKDVGAGQVQLTMENLLQSSSEFVPGWFFNFDPAQNASSVLTFTFSSGQAAQAVNSGVNTASTPGQGGDFDIEFAFENANNANRFTQGETSVYLITGSGISAASFNFPSVNEQNAFVSVFKVQGIQTSPGSGEVAGGPAPPSPVPAPPTAILAGLGVLGFGGWAGLRRRLTRAA